VLNEPCGPVVFTPVRTSTPPIERIKSPALGMKPLASTPTTARTSASVADNVTVGLAMD
jgi:hypothetical protein